MIQWEGFSTDLAHWFCLLCPPSCLGGHAYGEGKKSEADGKECNVSCCLEAICEGSHLSLLDLLPGTPAGDDTEDASTEFTDSIEEEAALNSHQQVSPSQALGSQGGRLTGPWGLEVSRSLVDLEWEALVTQTTSQSSSCPPSASPPPCQPLPLLHFSLHSTLLFFFPLSLTPAPCPVLPTFAPMSRL